MNSLMEEVLMVRYVGGGCRDSMCLWAPCPKHLDVFNNLEAL